MDKKEITSYKMKYATLDKNEKHKLRQRLNQDIEHHQNIIQDKKQLINLLIK